MTMNVRSRQLAAVERMLRLEGGGNAGGAGLGQSQQWKVLVYDSYCRDIISPLLTVGKLRENGVTLHMLLESARESIPDVPAVYFVQPTAENVRLFAQDCQRQLYDTAYLNFCSPLSKELMEVLAKTLVEVNAVSVVSKVYDQYMGFVSLESELFTLNMKDSFARYNSPSLQDSAIEQCMDEIARGLCSTVATLGVAPIIRCPPSGPAEMVARKVCSMLRELLESEDSFFAQGVSRNTLDQRPLLLIVDRSVDMSAPLMHTKEYQSLVDDLLDMGLNRVKVIAPPVTNADGIQVPNPEPPKIITVDKETDTFWASHGGSMLSEAVEAHAAELKRVEQQEDLIKRQTGRDTSSLGAANTEGGSDTSALLNTVQSLPALLEKKRVLERHLSIFRAAMGIISARQVHRFVEPEADMIFTNYADKAKVLELAGDTALLLRDKVRLLAIYLLTANPSAEDAEQIEGKVQASSEGEVLDAATREELWKTIAYVKKVLSLSKFGRPETPPRQPGGATGTGNLWDLAALTRTAIQRQVQTIVGEARLLATTRMMHLACKEVTSEKMIKERDAQLLYMDPKVQSGEVPQSARVRTAFTKGILFVAGGGCFAEFQNLQDFASGKLESGTSLLGGDSRSGSKAQFLYGCSELVNADRFISQLAKCT